ncbi:hypothetical protein A2U01_0047244, partial [Trifolium medium]|nr:hypothetical protein [Trifolium medium]
TSYRAASTLNHRPSLSTNILQYHLPNRAKLNSLNCLTSKPSYSLRCGEVESAQHLFLSCSTFGPLWSLVCSWIGSSLVDFHTLSDRFVQFTISTGGLRARRSFMQLIYGLFASGLCGPKETIDCSEAQKTHCITCWTRSRLFPIGG